MFFTFPEIGWGRDWWEGAMSIHIKILFILLLPTEFLKERTTHGNKKWERREHSVHARRHEEITIWRWGGGED